MYSRLKNLQKQLSAIDLDAYLVTNEIDVSYLTEYPSSESWLLVFPRKVFYLTDARYSVEAKDALPGITVYQYKKSAAEVEMVALLKRYRAKAIGFDSRHVSLAVFKRIKKSCPAGMKLIVQDGVVDELRQFKDKGEIAKLRECLRLNLAAYEYLRPFIRPGITERGILKKFEKFVWDRRVKFSFPPIIASGPNSALPHARVTDRKLSKNDVVLIDCGIEKDGYRSDLTRIFFLGKIPALLRERYHILSEAQKEAIRHIRPGVAAKTIDQAARNYLEKNKLASYCCHSLGHGVGLDVHEAPRISKLSKAVLAEGMIFTVEPGIYFPHQYGLRIEDMVLVTRDGCEVLSQGTPGSSR